MSITAGCGNMECGSAFATGLIGGIVYQGGGLGGDCGLGRDFDIVQLHAIAHYQLPLHTCKSVGRCGWGFGAWRTLGSEV